MPDGKSKWYTPAIATAVAIATGIAVEFHKGSLNADGPHWWLDWQRLPGGEVFPWLLLAVVPLIAAQFVWPRWKKSALLLLMISAMALQFLGVCVRADPIGIQPLIKIVQTRGSIGYYFAADELQQKTIPQVLKDYPQLLPTFPIHGREKPPGPVLYYYFFIKIFGPGAAAAIAGAIGILLFTSISIPATYSMAVPMLHHRNAAFHAATCVCLTPGMVMFFPFFDPCYIAVFCLMYLTWDRWLLTGKLWHIIAFAAILSVTTFWAYNSLVTGTFLLAMSILRWFYRGPVIAKRLFLGAAITVSFIVCAYILLNFATQFNPIATFRAAVNEQAKADVHLGRDYINTMPTNLLGFAIGMGPGLVIVSAMALLGHSWQRIGRYRRTAILIGFGQILLVAASGLLKSETDRVWMFLCPLVAIPAGWEITHWPPRWRAAFYASSWFLAVACLQNMRAATFHL